MNQHGNFQKTAWIKIITFASLIEVILTIVGWYLIRENL